VPTAVTSSGSSASVQARRADSSLRGRRARIPHADRRRLPPLVLLVDDLEDQREIYRQYLEFVGYRVVTARDGFEGIDRALSMRPDVVVMDLAMPGLDGFETTQRLKMLEGTRRIPVIALTAHGELPREWAIKAGCTAYLRKPCDPSDLTLEITAALRAAPSPAETERAPAVRANPRVLVVDDDADARELFAEYLEYHGAAVSVAADGDEALRDIRQLRPDVIVMDLDMPRLDGWEVMRRLRRDPMTRDIPVIAVSGHVLDADRERAFESGCHAFLSKPCLPESLQVEVQRALRRGKRTSS